MSPNLPKIGVLVCLLSLPAIHGISSVAVREPVPSSPVEVSDGIVKIRGDGISVNLLVRALDKELGVEVLGLEQRALETVSVSLSGRSVEGVLKKLMRALGEANYVFEYAGNRLFRVTVFPAGVEGKTKPRLRPPPTFSAGPVAVPKPRVGAVRIRSVIEGSQAERLDLRPGDLILEYDGVRVRRAPDLVAAVRRKAGQGSVDMVIMREGTRMDLTLGSGFIGVRIESVRIPLEELPRELREWD